MHRRFNAITRWVLLAQVALPAACDNMIVANLSAPEAATPGDEAETPAKGGAGSSSPSPGTVPTLPTATSPSSPALEPGDAGEVPLSETPAPAPTPDLTPPTATLTNQPSGTGHFVDVSVQVGGNDVVEYKFKFISAADDCTAMGGYSAATPVATPLELDLSSESDGPYTLCVVGADLAGNWQPPTSATAAGWTLDLTPPAPITGLTPTTAYKGANLNWTASSSSDVAGYVVVMRAGAAPTWQPADGVAAAVDLSGAEKVVYVGNATTFSATDLAFDTFHFTVYAFDAAYNYAPAVTASVFASRWNAISTVGAPSPRKMMAFAWTGATGDSDTSDRLIVWGGQSANTTYYADGAIYNPADDTWAPMSSTNAPSARQFHDATRIAFWTGATGHAATANRFVVWGGKNANTYFNTGAIYDPAADDWTPMSTIGAPPGREWFSSVWTGDTGDAATRDRLIVWGGEGAAGITAAPHIYDMRANTWSVGTATGAPGVKKYTSAVWSGGKMIVWGGFTLTNAGGVYDPKTNQWTATPTTGAPSARRWHGATWIGETGVNSKSNMMMIYGGYSTADQASGGLYNPTSNGWTPVSTTGAPAIGRPVAMQQLGSKMLVLGFSTPSLYDIVNDSWQVGSSVGALGTVRYGAWAWTGAKVIFWGGSEPEVGVGSAYDPHW